jgi:uncharacterized protein (DUF1697 family)
VTVHVALLRAINVGGNTKVAMSDLRGFVAALGFVDVQSLLQTGNLVFRDSRRTASALEKVFESEAAKRLDLQTDFFVRTAKEWEAIVEKNPFRDEARTDPSHLVVMLLKSTPDAKAMAALRAAISGREVVASEGRQAYIVYPDGIGRSRLTNRLIEAKLGTRGTGRNWNTVLRLAALARA